MSVNDMSLRIAGEAGQGVESSGAGFTIALARGGLHLFGEQDYMSRVRGGLNFHQVRIGEKPIHAPIDEVHLLLALSQEAIDQYGPAVVAGGGVIYDEGLTANADALRDRGVLAMPTPLVKIAEELGSKVMSNTAALGLAAGVTGYDLEYMNTVIRENFARKGDTVVSSNLEVARRAYQYGKEHYASQYEHKIRAVDAPKRMLISGNEAVCLGAVMGGCRFLAAYPMTPASSILEWMAGHADRYGLVIKHAEDEIAAINMAIGANHAGVRGMVSTSGGGYALMVEGLGLAGMTETPLVVIESQRPGPATGMPTRTAQADLLFVVFTSPGEFPRIVLAPGTIEECFEAGWRALNLAEKYQTPCFILLDKFLSSSARTIERADFHFDQVKIDRGALLTDADLDQLSERYKRYALTESGISPRALPGHPKAVFQSCSDEHDEYGNFQDEDAENRNKMVEKRLRKMDASLQDMRPPTLYGPPSAEVTFVGWGSTYGPLREAVDRLGSAGTSANMVHFGDIWPFPVDKAQAVLKGARRLVAVEGNATGQFADLLRMKTGLQVQQHIHRYDGRPFTAQYILDHLG